ncbi:DUF72 domain-containing protein [Amphibacillus cookii]|uniref:DUF72 domain-containing protein n=1 Tax=Amphibacillus cookii TaxID=767787 RepID=UPI00195EADF8|nr:DUF72 domain-containing protein [Amphibacillus cookii]MBM7541982.1 uncharacterized protein YecE (DUF72 family) [Amphibacillus cookii]
MIYIGLTGWGDHYSLYPADLKAKDKLAEYSSYFPTVEVDASFYAVQPIRNAEKWVNETPQSFRFVVKAYQGMTGHQRTELPYPNKTEMFEAFKASLVPYIEADKLAMVLFQFPPWFDCKEEHILYLKYCKQRMDNIPVALEFRHQSWFAKSNREKTLAYMRTDNWIHTIADEPQAGDGSIPIVPVATNQQTTLIRFHGRNVHGWNRPKTKSTNWREVRYLYNYNQAELLEWKQRIKALEEQSQDIYLLFNNNSGGDAANNAQALQRMLGIGYQDLASQQLRLF